MEIIITHINLDFVFEQGSKIDIGVWFIFWKHIIFQRAQDLCFLVYEYVSTRFDPVIILLGT